MTMLLMTRITVADGKQAEYLRLAAAVGKVVMESELAMLHHTFDQDLQDPCKFVWSECYLNDEALLFHRVNPPSPNISMNSMAWLAPLILALKYIALLRKRRRKPACFYDPTGMIQRDERAVHGIPIIIGRDELQGWLASLELLGPTS